METPRQKASKLFIKNVINDNQLINLISKMKVISQEEFMHKEYVELLNYIENYDLIEKSFEIIDNICFIHTKMVFNGAIFTKKQLYVINSVFFVDYEIEDNNILIDKQSLFLINLKID